MDIFKNIELANETLKSAELILGDFENFIDKMPNNVNEEEKQDAFKVKSLVNSLLERAKQGKNTGKAMKDLKNNLGEILKQKTV